MLGLLLRLIALICFVLAGVNQTLFNQPPPDLIAWGLGAWVLATVLEPYGPRFVYGQR